MFNPYHISLSPTLRGFPMIQGGKTCMSSLSSRQRPKVVHKVVVDSGTRTDQCSPTEPLVRPPREEYYDWPLSVSITQTRSLEVRWVSFTSDFGLLESLWLSLWLIARTSLVVLCSVVEGVSEVRGRLSPFSGHWKGFLPPRSLGMLRSLFN